MSWTNSKISRQMLTDFFVRTSGFAMDFDSDAAKVALYNNSITPDNDAAAASFAYNAGQWANANEVADGSEWAAGGVAIASAALNSGTADAVFYDGVDTASGSSATLANVFGGLVYDDTVTTPVADQGMSYNYFGGTNSITDGLFTVVWHANGIWRITL